MTTPPARGNGSVLKRIVKLIPRPIVDSAAKEPGAPLKAGIFTQFPRLAAMLFARRTHAIGLNDIRSTLRNNLSHANRSLRYPPSAQ